MNFQEEVTPSDFISDTGNVALNERAIWIVRRSRHGGYGCVCVSDEGRRMLGGEGVEGLYCTG